MYKCQNIVGIPRELVNQALCEQVRNLTHEDVLKDTLVVFKTTGVSIRMSAFVLSLVSPVLYKTVCGSFRESTDKTLVLEEVQRETFVKLLNLATGMDSVEVANLTEAVEMGKLADRFEMLHAVAALEDFILKNLSVENCPLALAASMHSGLARVEESCRELALFRFEELAATPAFLDLDPSTLSSLLDDDNLIADSEEAIFQATIAWIRSAKDDGQTSSVLSKIRYPLISDLRLAHTVLPAAALPGCAALKDLVWEARTIKHVPEPDRAQLRPRFLGPRALVPRAAKGAAAWRGGGGAAPAGHAGSVLALAECAGHVCSGGEDGRICLWSKASMQHERTIPPPPRAGGAGDHDSEAGGPGPDPEGGSAGGVVALAACEERGILVSSHEDWALRVWDIAAAAAGVAVAPPRPRHTLAGHGGVVNALAFCPAAGGCLASASDDRTVRIWEIVAGGGSGGGGGGGADAPWACARTLAGHAAEVLAAAAWRGGARVATGSRDRTVRIWDPAGLGPAGPGGPAAAGGLVATLTGHGDAVVAVAATEEWVLSSSLDRTIRVWAAAAAGAGAGTVDATPDDGGGGGWAVLRVLEVCPAGAGQYANCLAVCGGGGGDSDKAGQAPPRSASTGAGSRNSANLNSLNLNDSRADSDPSRAAGGGSGRAGPGRLVCGVCDYRAGDGEPQYEAAVWDLGRLERVHTLDRAAGAVLWALLAVGGEVWGAVGGEVVVWGRALGMRGLG